ncbi:MAG: hypothetical protein ACLS59_06880 [Clostridia bacterium]
MNKIKRMHGTIINSNGLCINNNNTSLEETADKLFEELGYEKKEQKNEYGTHIWYYQKNGANEEFGIEFAKSKFEEKGEIYCVCHSERDEAIYINMEELQAINKKCKELRLDMMNKCKYITIRTKNYEKYFYCRLKKKIINYTTDCIKCFKSEPRKNKGINKKTSKQIKLEKSRYSILTDDLEHCYICRFQGKKVLRDDLHEVYGGANRKRSILNGFVTPLCRKHHQNEEILSKLKITTQRMYEVNHTRDEFIKLIGKSYIK